LDTSNPPPRRFYRHRLPVRVMHWINAVSFFILLMSGLNIFNAHADRATNCCTRRIIASDGSSDHPPAPSRDADAACRLAGTSSAGLSG